MKREISDRNIIDNFVIDFCEVVEKHCKYIIVSGFVSISHGRSRGTEDVDMIIEKLPLERFRLLNRDLEKKGFECIQSPKAEEIYDYLIKKDSVRYVRKGEYLPEMELKFAKDEIDELQLSSRVKLPLTGLDVWFSSIEMNIAFKEELLKSDKDMEDARHLRKIYEDEISEELINDVKKMIRRYRLNAKR
ncbi:MAG: hypothetical protein AABX48_02610 [Nanoarchaeota archaeon]